MPSFPPVHDRHARILILGSMPGRRSLQEREYYAHPRNAFWWIMGQLLNFDYRASYAQRIEHLLSANVALWDVLHDCTREGSLDSAIVRDSEQANDIDKFMCGHEQLSTVAFNGGAAGRIFMRHFPTLIDSLPRIRFQRLPSSSPAHARLDREAKLTLWRQQLEIHE